MIGWKIYWTDTGEEKADPNTFECINDAHRHLEKFVNMNWAGFVKEIIDPKFSIKKGPYYK